MEREEIFEKLYAFVDEYYRNQLMEIFYENRKSLLVDFSVLEKFDVELADYLLENPEEVIEIFEEVIKEFDFREEKLPVRVRFFNLPKDREMRIRNIRAEHIGKLIAVEGIVKRASEIRPEVFEAVFECPECGNRISVIQTERTIVAPTKCELCGTKRGFRLIDQKLYDARWIVIEEPYEIVTGERPSEIMVYLKEDLTSPKMQNKTDPGNRIKVIGILKQMQRRVRGTKSRQMEIYIEANYVEAVETEWEEIEISPEDEKKILELAKDPQIYQKFIASIAPGIYGLEEVKEAILLQLFGGEPKVLPDGSRIRGDIHILLIGDPSTAKSQIMKVVSSLIPRGKYVSGKGVSIDYDDPVIWLENGMVKIGLIGEFCDEFFNKFKVKEGFVKPDRIIEVPVLNPVTLKMEWRPLTYVYRHKVNKKLIKIKLATGREVIVTDDHSLYTFEDGRIKEKKSSELRPGDILIVPSKLPSPKKRINVLDLFEGLRKILNLQTDGIYVFTPRTKHKLPRYIKVCKELLYILGFFVADGFLHGGKESWQVHFILNKKEKNKIEKLVKCIQKVFGIKPTIVNKGKAKVVTINSKLVFHFFRDVLGLKNYAKEKGVPSIVFNVRPDLQLEFLRGWVDGDSGVTTSKQLMSDILYLLLLNGIIGSFTEKRMRGKIKFPDHESIVNTIVYELKVPKPHYLQKGLVEAKRRRYKGIPLKFFKSFPFNRLKPSGYKRVTKKSLNLIFSKNKALLYKRLELLVKGFSVDEICKIEKKSKKTIRAYYNLLAKKGFVEKRGKSYKLTRKGMELLKDVWLVKKLINSDIAFVPIKKIEYVRPTNGYVYDLCVSGYENFVGGFGGILCHNTGVGLTATVVRDEEFLGGWVLEAGALVMCNKSLIAIDEFEKINKQDQIALHEAMEGQTISIAKASIVATLPAQTAILAGGNPKLGRFDPYVPIKEQVDIPETLLSRFDLKFALRDIPNPELDKKIAEHILQSRFFDLKKATPVIPPDLFRKYVAYARKHCHPKMTEEAAQVLKEFYLSLRQRSGEDSPISITPRQLEALIRLAEASAKVQLRDKITKEDALRAIRLMSYSLRQFGFEPSTGQIDIDRAEGLRVTAAQRSKIRVVREIILQLESTYGKEIPQDEVIKRCKEAGIEDAEDILRKMSQEGLIYHPKPGFIARL